MLGRKMSTWGRVSPRMRRHPASTEELPGKAMSSEVVTPVALARRNSDVNSVPPSSIHPPHQRAGSRSGTAASTSRS